MNMEDRVRTALHDVAGDTPVDPGSYDRIERKTAVARRRRRVVGGGVAALLVVVGVAVPLALRDGDSQSVQVGPASDSRSTTTTTDTTVGGPEPAVPDHDFVWPAGDDRTFEDGLEVATAFAHEYLGMVGVVAEGTGNDEITVRPGTEGGGPAPADGPRTVIRTAALDGRPVVVGAASPNIQVDTPTVGATIAPPVRVSGRARNLYEGNVIVEFRNRRGELVNSGVTTAGGSGPDLAPFSVDVPIEKTTGQGAVVVKSDSGIEGTPEATVVPVTFTEGAATTQVTVFLLDAQQDFVPVTREVPRTTGVLRAALLELLEGASPEEEARGLHSPFDGHEDHLRGVTITEDGTAIVDLVPDFGNNSSTSAMSAAIVGSLDRTVFQFPNVTWVAYRFNGECGGTIGDIDPDFFCERRTRDEY